MTVNPLERLAGYKEYLETAGADPMDYGDWVKRLAKKTVTTFGGPIAENSGADIWPGQLFRVYWSNGAGESIYRLMDGSGAHQLQLIRETEYGNAT